MKKEAGSLHCPNCGAAVDPGARRCPYCQARLATVSCPSCFALMFEGAAYCTACGTKRSRIESEDTAARCPACRQVMSAATVGGTSLLECGRCDGVWVAADDFERLCAERDAQAAVLHHFAEHKPVSAGAAVRYRPCVRCGKMMNRVNFSRTSGTIVDVCRGHGTYLDAGELHAILTFVRGGGLERARKRQLDDIKEEQRRLRERQARAAEASGRGWTVDVGSWSGGGIIDLLSMIRGD
jgi:Zn-finger nucleic acid-binding protein